MTERRKLRRLELSLRQSLSDARVLHQARIRRPSQQDGRSDSVYHVRVMLVMIVYRQLDQMSVECRHCVDEESEAKLPHVLPVSGGGA